VIVLFGVGGGVEKCFHTDYHMPRNCARCSGVSYSVYVWPDL